MFKNQKSNAFTLVELMMLLLVASLIIAACIPVITKKHFKLPSTVIHGSYLCYYDKGRLHETKWVGRVVQKKILDRDTDNCVFEPPARAPYFQVSLIGGGGGGGDSGYTGGNMMTGTNPEAAFGPYNIVETCTNTSEENCLSNKNISKEQFLAHAGTLRGYAQGSDSGKGGNVNYIEIKQKETCSDPVSGAGAVYKGTETSNKEIYTCQAAASAYQESPNLFSRIVMGIADFFKAALAFKPGVITGAAAAGETCKTVTKDGTYTPGTLEAIWHERTCRDCIEWELVKTGTKYVDVPDGPKKKESYPCTICDTHAGSTESDTGTRQDGNGNAGCHDGTCYRWVQPTKKVLQDVYENKCKTYGTPYDCGYYTHSYTDGTYSDLTENESECPSGYECKYSKTESTNIKKYGTDTVEYCCNKWNYEYSPASKTCSGGEGGTGAKCTSSSTVAGNLNLSYEAAFKPETSDGYKNGSDINTSVPSNNDASVDVNGNVIEDEDSYKLNENGCFESEAEAGDGTAICADGTSNHECSDPSYMEYTIIDGGSKTTVKAGSAISGGTGASRGIKNVSFDKKGTCNTEQTANNADTIDGITKTCDSCTQGTAGKSGTCIVGQTSNWCDGKQEAGYCLMHDYPDGPEIEADGKYHYYDTWASNYLQSGDTGEPGEFKTLLVRSLKDMDTTIHIGRGGSAAPVGSGNAGSDGSPTIFGTGSDSYIAMADGGAGGKGGKGFAAYDPILPEYDHDTYMKEDACFYKTKYLTKKDDGSWAYSPTTTAAQEAAAKIREEYSNGTSDSYCSEYTTTGKYKYHKQQGGTLGDYPTPIGIISTVMSYIFNTKDTSTAVQTFIKFGRGGQSGGVEHRCWAGPREVWFEKHLLLDTSVFPTKNDAEEAYDNYQTNYGVNPSTEFNGLAKTALKYVPDDCHDDWDYIPAGSGSDGALLIKW